MSRSRRSLLEVAATGAAAFLAGCVARVPNPPTTPSSPSEPSSASITPSPTPTVAPTPSTAPDPLPTGIVNALVFGTDSRDPQSFSGNSDAIIVAQISADRTSLSLVSVARDSYVSVGNGKAKINASYATGGTPMLRQTVSNLLGGLPIHMTALANFNNFIAITRWLGGIRVINRHATTTTVISTGRVVDFPEGEILLQGTDGLIYARERKTLPLGDLDRAERHRALITGMLRGLQAVAGQRPTEFGPLATRVIQNTKVTDFDPVQVAALATPLSKIDLAHVTSLMVPISRFDMINGASVDVVNEAQTRELGEALKAGNLADYLAKYGTAYTPR